MRIDDGSQSRIVTRYVTDLQFTSTAPGGFSRAQMRLTMPRDTFAHLGPADRVWVFDPRNGETLWEGYTENPGNRDGRSGESWDLTAIGSAVLASDVARPVIYVDNDLNAFERDNSKAIPAFATTQITGDPNGTGLDGLLLGFQSGQNVSVGVNASMSYRRFTEAGQGFASITVTGRSGKPDSGYRVQLFTTAIGVEDDKVLFSDLGMLDEWNLNTRVIGTASGPPAGVHRVALRLIRTTAGGITVADEQTWTFLTRITLVGRRMDKFGALTTGPDDLGSATYIQSNWVVEDVIARHMPLVDPVRSLVEAPVTPWQIDQLMWTDAVRAEEILSSLELFEPDMLWEILESDQGGKFRFNYRRWNPTPRYIFSTKDGWEAPGGDDDLCNSVAVSWTDANGDEKSITVTADVPDLTRVGRIRQAPPIRLLDGVGSPTNAQRAGTQALASRSTPPNAGRLALSRPVLDQFTGLMVQPFEVQTGYTARIREEGIDLRITAKRYDDEAGVADLTLGDPAPTQEQRLARLVKGK